VPLLKEAKERKRLSMDVYPQDNRYLELKTGGFFCNPEYPHGEKSKQKVFGFMHVIETFSDEHRPFPIPNLMSYFETSTSPLVDTRDPAISFECFLPSDEFRDLTTNIRNRLMPSSVRVSLNAELFSKESVLQSGWEPDGSGLIWNNDPAASGKRAIEIEDVTFSYDALKSKKDEEDQSAETKNIDAEELKDQLKAIEESIAFHGRWLVLLVGIGAVASIVVAVAAGNFVALILGFLVFGYGAYRYEKDRQS
jgi:hypothetical protein